MVSVSQPKPILPKITNTIISGQILSNGVRDEKVLVAFKQIDRTLFVPKAYEHVSYVDSHIPLDHQQVMLSPRELALFLQAAKLTPKKTILEVGTGRGYLTALLAFQGYWVTSYDIYPDFTQFAQNRLKDLNLNNVTYHTADPFVTPPSGTFDVIICTNALPYLPQKLFQLSAPSGIILAIVGKKPIMQAIKLYQAQQNTLKIDWLFQTLVPFYRTSYQGLIK